MKKPISVAIAAAIFATTLIQTPAFAAAPVPPLPPPPGGGGGGGGAGGAGGVIGVAAFFVVYDLIRRTTCSGDFLHLGGPGFDTKIKVGDTVLIPRNCYIPHHKVLHAKRSEERRVGKEWRSAAKARDIEEEGVGCDVVV